MDENSGERQPPRRPPAPPLKVNKDSHKIRKPPTAPPANPNRQPPVIIYEVSPEVHHTNPTEFMGLVQRLTGPPPRPAANEQMEMPPMIATTSDSLNHQMGGYGPPGGGPGPPMFSLPVPDPNPFRSMHNSDYYMSNVRSEIEGTSVDGNYIFESGAPSSSNPNAYISHHHHQLPSPDSLDNFFNNNIWYHQQQGDDDDNQ